MNKIFQYFIYKDIRFFLVSLWLTFLIFSALGTFFDATELTYGFIASVLSSYWVIKKNKNLKIQSGFIGKPIFFTPVGYMLLGISSALVLDGILFNVVYEPGWFNFSDFVFIFLTYPISALINFEYSNDILYSRIFLYVIVFINLLSIILVGDFIAKMLKNIFVTMKKIIK